MYALLLQVLPRDALQCKAGIAIACSLSFRLSVCLYLSVTLVDHESGNISETRKDRGKVTIDGL